MSRDEFRTPPHSDEAEIGLLGCMMADALRVVTLARVQFALVPESFYSPAHAVIAKTIFTMADEAKHVDLMTVVTQLRANGDLEAVGGEGYLISIMDRTPMTEGAAYYAETVKQRAVARDIITKAREIAEEAYTTQESDTLLAEASNRFLGIQGTRQAEASNEDVMEACVVEWEEARKHKKPAIDLHMPWPSMTELMQGLEVGVTIVAGRPSAGKTTLEGLIAAYQCESGFPVARATADSSRKQLLQRMLCNKGGVSLAKLKFGFARNEQIESLREAKRKIAKYPMWINDHDTEITAICRWARYMKARHGIRLLTVDYIQQLRAGHLGGYASNDTVARVTAISSMLKALSFELGIPVLVLSQLSREVEKEGRAPRLSDLRDSGGIEQDASKVLFAWVDSKKAQAMDLADSKHEATKHKRPVWVALLKNKDGGTGNIPFWMYPPYFSFAPAVSKTLPDGTWSPFGDDVLPCGADRDYDEKQWEQDEQLIPADEGEAKPGDD